MKKISRDYTVVLFTFTIILLLVIQLSAEVVDVTTIINTFPPMMILVTTITIREPLKLSIFPSLSLITTLFRLGVNVSITRNILADRGAPGLAIKASDDFVLRGNVVAGLTTSLIIVLVQFIAITRGAEHVAKVTTRFNLDTMSGKQMAIDAGLSSGLIDGQQAKRRREKIQREADFYGTMDGATKTVRGDAVMSLITAAINLIGGSVIGYIQSGDSISNALDTYSIATVGDGLVGRMPALLISTATDMIITRTVSEGSLNEDVSKQLLAQLQTITIGGVAVTVLAVIPRMPVIQFVLIPIGLSSRGHYLTKQTKEEPSLIAESACQDTEVVIPGEMAHQEAAVSENAAEEYYKDINNVYTLLTVESVEMEFGYSLIPPADEPVGGGFINHVAIFRRQYAQSMGFVIPSIRLRGSFGLSADQYCTKIKGEEVAQGEILVDYYLVLEPDQLERKVGGIEAMEPAYGIPSRWTRPEDREGAELHGHTVISPLSIMVTHLSEVIKQYTYELMTRQEAVHLVKDTGKTTPELVEKASPNLVLYSLFQRILTSLLKEGTPIKDLEAIIGAVIEVMSKTDSPVKDIDSIAEHIRAALKRITTCMYYGDRAIKVITLDPELERIMVGPLSKGEGGYYLVLNPDILQSIIGQMAEQLREFNGLAQSPIVLTFQITRMHFYCLVEQFYLNVQVLFLGEITNNVQIQPIDGLRLEVPMGRRV